LFNNLIAGVWKNSFLRILGAFCRWKYQLLYLLIVDKYLGTLEVGKIANISIVEGNPLQDIHDTQRVRYVLVNGKVYVQEDLLKQP
jgi:predicted amidohydrolase YtcJ